MLKGYNEMITDDKLLTELFNEHYMNIVEPSKNPEKIVCPKEDFDKKVVLHNIIKKYENHSSIIKIRNNMSVKNHSNSNNIPNTKQLSGTDKIPTKLVKLASNFLSTSLEMAVNNSLALCKFPDISTVATIDKKTGDKYDISNF